MFSQHLQTNNTHHVTHSKRRTPNPSTPQIHHPPQRPQDNRPAVLPSLLRHHTHPIPPLRPRPPRSFTSFDNSCYDRRNGVCIPKSARLAYDGDTEELVVKIMGLLKLECSNRMFATEVFLKVHHMGVETTEEELVNTGAATCKVGSESREADSSFQPCKRGRDRWPTLVVGVGFEGGVGMLRGDAGWWVIKSGGEVRIAVVIRLCWDEQRIVVETWEMPRVDEGGRVTRSSSHQAPVRMQEVRIDEGGVWGAPLVLGFEKVFERAPVPSEGDIVFSA